MWTKDVAKIWTNYVPPCRPSRFELDVCYQFISAIRSKGQRQPKVLILGSTTEYRELGFEENCNVTIMDNSIEYHEEISKEIKYRNLRETIMIQDWQNMSFISEFDLILGDLVIGNMKPKEIDVFLEKISSSLCSEGVFITKSFFYQNDIPIENPEMFFRKYETEFRYLDPFPFNAYNLTVFCMDKKNHVLRFHDMFLEIKRCFEERIISEDTYNRYLQFGWQDILKTEFYVMPRNSWEDSLRTHFSSFEKKISEYHWAKQFPLYIIKK